MFDDHRRLSLTAGGISILLFFCSACTAADTRENGGFSSLKDHELSLSSPILVQRIDARITPALPNYVRIKVVKVNNPTLIPISFTLDYKPERGVNENLGSFSLFPPDNSGTFIVATGNRVRSSGALTLTLVPVMQVQGEPILRVMIQPMELLDSSVKIIEPNTKME